MKKEYKAPTTQSIDIPSDHLMIGASKQIIDDDNKDKYKYSRRKTWGRRLWSDM